MTAATTTNPYPDVPMPTGRRRKWEFTGQVSPCLKKG